VYEVWKKSSQPSPEHSTQDASTGGNYKPPAAQIRSDVPVGDLGSGSDYTVFLQHLGVPSTDIGSTGDYGVYHSVFDNFAWFKKFADPDFLYEQQMARVFGLEIIRMAGADVLPYDYEDYGKEIMIYLDAAKTKPKYASEINRLTLQRPWRAPAISNRPARRWRKSNANCPRTPTA